MYIFCHCPFQNTKMSEPNDLEKYLQLNEQLNEKAENIETDFNFNLDSLNLAEELNENNTLKNVLGQEFDNLEEKISKDVQKSQSTKKSEKIRTSPL